MIKHKLLFVLLSSLLLSACARKAQYNEEVRYTISYTNGKVSGDVYHSCYNLDNDSNPCSTDSGVVFKSNNYLCDLNDKLYFVSNSQNILQEGFTCTRSVSEFAYPSRQPLKGKVNKRVKI